MRLEFSDVQLDPSLLAVGAPPGAGVDVASGQVDGGGAGVAGGDDSSSGMIPQPVAALDPLTAAAGALPIGRLIARVTVTDEGAGVPLEHQANLFKVSQPLCVGCAQRGVTGLSAVRCMGRGPLGASVPLY